MLLNNDTEWYALAAPVLITAAMVLWATFVPQLAPGATWVVLPTILTFPIVVLWHIGLVVYGLNTNTEHWSLLVYGLANSTTCFLLWVLCLIGSGGPSL